jgi:hypothetical protein
METKENTQESSKVKSNETRIVCLVQHPDGTATVKAFVRDEALPDSFQLNGAKEVSTKKFETVPKKINFFFEKGFIPNMKPLD